MTYSTHCNKKKNLKVVKNNIINLLTITGVWFLFFWLYSKTGSDDYRFLPIVIFMLGIYVVLEIVTTVLTFFVEVEEEEIDTFEHKSISLNSRQETKDQKKSNHHNGNPDQEREPIKC